MKTQEDTGLSGLAARIQQRMNALGLSRTAAAAKAGLTESTIRNIFEGKSKSPRVDTLHAIAEALETSTDWLSHGEGSEQPAQPARSSYKPPPQLLGDADIPVFSAVEGGIGEIVVSTDPIYSVPRPWYLHNAPGYAVLVTGDSMAPVYEPGDMVVVNPRLPPVPGKQAIFIEGADNGDFTATVKRFLRSTPEHWHVQQFNPAKEFTLPKKRWTRALRIVGKYDGG